MNRRNFLLGAGGVALASTAVGSVSWLSVSEFEGELTIAATLRKLETIKQHNASSVGDWNLAQVLEHCAQSVEYSMTGFPESKSALFTQTIGPLAFNAFAAKKKMHHPLNEAIPGAPALNERTPLITAYARFEKSMRDFEKYTGELAEHFAYGYLSKPEYEIAHAMHFNNHLLEITTT